MTEQQKKVGGCYAIFLGLGVISALLLTIAGAFEMPSYMLIFTAIWIVASLAISMAVPGGGGFALSEVFTLFYCSQWWNFVTDITIMRQNRYSKDVSPIAYIAPFVAAVALWYIGYIVRDKIDESREAKISADYYRKKAEEEFRAERAQKEAEKAKAQAALAQVVKTTAVESAEPEPESKSAQDTVQNPDADEEEKRAAKEARREAEEAQRHAEESRRRVEEAQKQVERAAKRMEDAMKRAKLAQEELKKAQAEAEKLKNQNKKP